MKVLGKRIPIKLTDALAEDDGQYLTQKNIILIASGQEPQQELETRIHEILHAVWSGMDIGHPKLEESVVNKLAKGLTAVLADNEAKSAISWLMRLE